MAKGAGFNPNFDHLNEDEAKDMLTTGIEVLRMMRDGDSNSDNERARNIYATLVTTDPT